MCSKAARRQRGLTLVELLMFIVVISIALVGILQVFRFITQNSADPVRRKQALMIAEGLLEEVQLAQFTFCAAAAEGVDAAAAAAECALPPATGPRPFDYIDDYVRAAAASPAVFDVNNVLSDATAAGMRVSGYRARLSIVPEALGTLGAGATAASSEVLRIRVEVDYDGQTLALDGYRTRYAPTVQ